MNNVLSYMTFIPVAGAAIVLALPNNAKLIRWVSALATVPPLLMAIWLFKNFDRAVPGFQFVEDYAWIPAYNISYTMGVDGLSISMILLTALLSFLCIFASFGIDKAVKGYFALFLLLDAGMHRTYPLPADSLARHAACAASAYSRCRSCQSLTSAMRQ